MSSELYVALSGAIGRLHELDVTANNLANADTVGFKRVRGTFSAALEAATRDMQGERIPGDPAEVFAVLGSPRVDLASGPVERTGSPLDVALEGDGFFVVAGPQGPLFTRAGSFVIGPDGNLATPDGLPVEGASGPIAVGTRPVSIVATGDVVAEDGEIIGRLRVVDFPEAAALVPDGGNRLRAEGALPTDVENPRVLEGSLERSNVRPVEEMAALVELQRSFDIVMRSIQADADLSERLLREVSGQ